MLERTLSIIKPDAVKAKKTGEIIASFEKNNFNIIAQKKILLTKLQAEKFYTVHKDKKFFGELVQYMISGPIIVQVLEKENAIVENRKLMGATNPKEAEVGTIRNLYGKNIEENAVHGSDSLENAKIEISFFFSQISLQ